MNERMIELYKEASEFAYKICREEGRAGGPSDHIWNTLSTGKFAELIVRECVGIVEGRGFLHDQAPDAIFARECSSAIKRHFGVK